MSSSDMYITNEHAVTFEIIRPGLSGDMNSASIQAIDDKRVAANENSLLELKEIEPSKDFKRAASFKIIQNKFLDVSSLYIYIYQFENSISTPLYDDTIY